MKSALFRTIAILISMTAAIASSKTQLRTHDLEIGAILFIILFTIKLTNFGEGYRSKIILACLFAFISVFIVFSTGMLTSPYFFLLYFLLFSLALLLEPAISIVGSIYLIGIFIFLLKPDSGLKEIVPILSMGLISPFALYLGAEHIALLAEKKRIFQIQTKTVDFLEHGVKEYLDIMSADLADESNNLNAHDVKRQLISAKRLIEEFETNIKHPSEEQFEIQ